MGQSGVRPELPFYPDRVVVGQPHCAIMVRAPAPRRLIVDVADASDNSLLGVGGHILRQLGPGSIYC